jgi:hypothetical protein
MTVILGNTTSKQSLIEAMKYLLATSYLQYLGEHPEDITLDIVFVALAAIGLIGLINSYQSNKVVKSLSLHNSILGSQIKTLADLTPPPDSIDLEIQNRLITLHERVGKQDQQLSDLLSLLEESTIEDILS